MSGYIYSIRNYRPADFDKYVKLNIEVEKLEPTKHYVSPQVLIENLSRPNYSPVQDLFVAETEGNIVGYMELTPEVKIGRVILNCLIHPDHRRKGLAAKLLEKAARRAKELGVKIAQVNIQQDNITAQTVLSKLGFEFVRRFLHLRLDIPEVYQQYGDRTGLTYHHLQRGEEDKLTKIQNRFFADTWGYNPNTVEEIVYATNLNGCSPEDIILACDGDRIIGYCWVRETQETAGNERKGQILMLGVDSDYRGQRTGKAILLAGLAHLKGKGLQVVELRVDSANEVACALYRSVGFKVDTSSLWYEKVIR